MNIELMIITHGELANILLRTAQDITGRTEGVGVREINRSEGIDKIRREIGRLSHNIPAGEGLLILTDMLGGTPSNVCIPLLKENNIEVITGVNLPMLLTAIHKKNTIKDLRELAEVVASAGREGILKCSECVDR